MLGAARQALRRTDASLPITYAQSIDDQIAARTALHRAMAQIALAFGGIALALAAIDLYGVLSYGVARRRSEIAARIALGARPGRVIAMVMIETGVVLIVGLILGAALTYEALGWIKSELYGVAPEDALTLGLAVGSRPAGGGVGRCLRAGLARVAARPNCRAPAGVAGASQHRQSRIFREFRVR